jgi:hypothetical protein
VLWTNIFQKSAYYFVASLLLLIIAGKIPTIMVRTSIVELENVDPSKYDIVFIYGVRGNRKDPVNKLDTIKGIFTKDMVADPPITFDLELSNQDIAGIILKMNQIEFWKYPTDYIPKNTGARVTPYVTYDVKVYEKGRFLKRVRMDTDIWSQDLYTCNLRSLFALIISTIEETEEYQNSPRPKSGYC